MTSDTQLNIEDIYRQYSEQILPLIALYEVLSNEFPIAVLNEIRAIFTHLARVYSGKTNAALEIASAKRHLERTLRDCYKYVCIAYNDEYLCFTHVYRYVDLSVVDNGNFLVKFDSAYSKARKHLLDAKSTESLGLSDSVVCVAYETATLSYKEVYDMINGDDYEKFVHLKHRAYRTYFLSWVFGIIGTLGTAFTIWDIFFG